VFYEKKINNFCLLQFFCTRTHTQERTIHIYNIHKYARAYVCEIKDSHFVEIGNKIITGLLVYEDENLPRLIFNNILSMIILIHTFYTDCHLSGTSDIGSPISTSYFLHLKNRFFYIHAHCRLEKCIYT